MRKLFLLLVLVSAFLTNTNACELKFSISGDKKEVYKAGEEVIIEIQMVLTHRICEIELSQSKFSFEGLKVLGATPWKEIRQGTFIRQVKIQISDDAKSEAKLALTRKCSKEGGYCEIIFKK
jgi:hypothetical protein